MTVLPEHKTDFDRRREALFLHLQMWPTRSGNLLVAGYPFRFKGDRAISGNVIVTREEWQKNYGREAS